MAAASVKGEMDSRDDMGIQLKKNTCKPIERG